MAAALPWHPGPVPLLALARLSGDATGCSARGRGPAAEPHGCVRRATERLGWDHRAAGLVHPGDGRGRRRGGSPASWAKLPTTTLRRPTTCPSSATPASPCLGRGSTTGCASGDGCHCCPKKALATVALSLSKFLEVARTVRPDRWRQSDRCSCGQNRCSFNRSNRFQRSDRSNKQILE